VSLPKTLDEALYASAYVCQTVDSFHDLLDLQRLEPQRYPHLLESVAHGTAQARYDILFAFPEYSVSLQADGQLVCEGTINASGDFLQTLDALWSRAALPWVEAAETKSMPFRGGWFVYLGYELVAQIESRLAHMPRDPALPVARLTRIPAAIIRDHLTRRTHLVCENECADTYLTLMRRDLGKRARKNADKVNVIDLHEQDSQTFLDGVQRTLEYIRAGDVFQVNLSRPWRTTLDRVVAPAKVYERLRRANPAPFAGLMTLGDRSAIISSSPERLVKVNGSHISTRPIAGTYPRSDDPEQDQRWSRDLLRHPKERAEHVMLIDLERNDLGRVCRPGTVRVEELMALESYKHVHHIVSEVSGTLNKGITPAQVIRAVFPGGTITGCPKVRCMEIIAELEGSARTAYTGSMGYVNRDGGMDLNILIRTIVQNGRQLCLRAGAGIVADSRPRRELEETRAKAKGMLRALGQG
jgi:anthranilate synthase component 1